MLFPSHRRSIVVGLALFAIPAAAGAVADEPRDPLRELQAEAVADCDRERPRAYHFGSQGPGSVFSNHTSHTNRLVSVYTFGKRLDLDAVTGPRSRYRTEAGVRGLYGETPANTVNPEAEYADQSDLYRVQASAIEGGVRHLFILWFDGLDWPTTRAAAIVKTGQVYDEGEGTGLLFQDYDADGSARYGFVVTSPTHDTLDLDADAQSVAAHLGSLPGGYDASVAGPNPWTLGPLAAGLDGYLKGQSADSRDREGVERAGRMLHAYTDSSCSAGEFATGIKSYNNGVNVDEKGRFVPTLFNRLQAEGWRVGTATSVPFDHASPAAMYAHNVFRDDYQDLAREMLGLESVVQQVGKGPRLPGLDVVLGTGFGVATNPRSAARQGKNAVPGPLFVTEADFRAASTAGGGPYEVVHTEAGREGSRTLREAAARAARNGHRLFGVFGREGLDHLPYRTADGQYNPAPNLDGAAEVYTPADLFEQPTLADMTEAAVTALSADPSKKFALFVEAGDVDFALHANNLDNAVGAVYSGEDAFRVIVDWVEHNSDWDESALIVTADHGHYLVIDDPEALAETADRANGD